MPKYYDGDCRFISIYTLITKTVLVKFWIRPVGTRHLKRSIISKKTFCCDKSILWMVTNPLIRLKTILRKTYSMQDIYANEYLNECFQVQFFDQRFWKWRTLWTCLFRKCTEIFSDIFSLVLSHKDLLYLL